jgi:general L-amino acid transport system permease protein
MMGAAARTNAMALAETPKCGSMRPVEPKGVIPWMSKNLFGSWSSGLVSVVLGSILLYLGTELLQWALLDAVWTVPGVGSTADTSACRTAVAGACWAVIREKYRLILFGLYPYAEQWRPAACILLFVGLYAVSADRRFWTWKLAFVWSIVLGTIGVLMWGGAFGLTFVAEDQWGGLPVTLILATFGLALAFPLAVLVALGRRSARNAALRMLCLLYVELIRGVPLISVLFMASVMFPLFMPDGMSFSKLLRVQIAIILFAAAYLSETIRAGLQSLDRGQAEAADALGLRYWPKMGLLLLPQALRAVIPPLVNTFIGFFKATSLVTIIGIFDLITAGNRAIGEPAWQGFGNEVYIFVGLIYFSFCFAMSRYSRSLEQSAHGGSGLG